MLATQTPDAPPEAKDVKQIKETLAQSLKALQKRYITSDAVVTSEDADANLLCCALEAIFIHGIRTKYIRSEAAGRTRKGDRGPLPQPFFWSLLKSVTHRDVIKELEKISFLGTDVGRCRAWLRLALNHGLLECYLASLFREDSKLRGHYQPSALLLNAEEREVLLSYLQGLASLTFSLSYKSSVLNEWTTTPLALAGLCPMSKADTLSLSHNGKVHPTSSPACKESWDTGSQSSGSSDALDVQRGGGAVLRGKSSSASQEDRTALSSSNLSLDTTGSSQLSSSLSSDSLLQGPDHRSLTGEQWSSCDLDLPINNHISKRTHKESLTGESGQCSQDSLREDSFVSSSGPDQFSETAVFSGSDSDIQDPKDPKDPPEHPESPLLSDPQLQQKAPDLSPENHVSQTPADGDSHSDPGVVFTVSAPGESPEVKEVKEAPEVKEQQREEEEAEEAEVEEEEEERSKPFRPVAAQRSINIVKKQLSAGDSLSHSRSWISEDDIYKPPPEVLSDQFEASAQSPAPDPEVTPSPPSVVHRRQIGLSNPFRGLLKLGHLERRGAMGLWRDHYCELSPFELRLYLNAEERTCCDNCYLVRCEDARVTSPDGRFEVAFPGKRLYLRATNRDEAEDWVDRIVEGVNKCRPANQMDEQWEILQPTAENGVDDRAASSTSSAPSSPEKGCSAADKRTNAGDEAPSPPVQDFHWTRSADLETDAIKESVLYYSTDPDVRTWAPMTFSLSLEALKGFRTQGGRKCVQLTHPVEEIRDVVPDVSQGGPEYFKLLTVKNTLRLRAENPDEARSWRVLIRGALDSYLESGEDDRLVQHRLKEDGALLVHLCTVPSEKGLDTQNFKCAGCSQQIGPSLGRARLCEFSGQYYCESCHHGDTTVIPSRMVHNWDLTQREVSKKALQLLDQIEQEPLINLDQLNPGLVSHAESMALVHNLRQRLRLLGDYVLTCRSKAYQKLQKRMGQRTYLLESCHVYSVMDLRQIEEGQYETFLMTLLQFASNHVFQCDLCSQRGFICQICHANDTIFPFQFDTTARCKVCKAVFHRACQTDGVACPRCERMKKYQERDLQD